ncbi:hypothetical protein QFC20_002565 [Naganishia adeliensis]|uniref:Uncharacterized protein n=1 Tax=Naganishia adeliensis TaxID=92952 RepID=A0ACC2WJS6_9TREE|nr:hypothetical protein QFC20_002565 [Naganishia adeliensis]
MDSDELRVLDLTTLGSQSITSRATAQESSVAFTGDSRDPPEVDGVATEGVYCTQVSQESQNSLSANPVPRISVKVFPTRGGFRRRYLRRVPKEIVERVAEENVNEEYSDWDNVNTVSVMERISAAISDAFGWVAHDIEKVKGNLSNEFKLVFAVGKVVGLLIWLGINLSHTECPRPGFTYLVKGIQAGLNCAGHLPRPGLMLINIEAMRLSASVSHGLGTLFRYGKEAVAPEM